MSDVILRLENMHYRYGKIHAVKGISLEVKKDELVCLIGANGAGKTTTLCAISGLLGNVSEGNIYFEDKKINNLKANQISRLGLAQCLEGRHVFSQLTVRENLMMGAYLRKDNLSKDFDYVFHLFPRLKEREKQMAGTLSGGEQQMLAVARALMQRPKILMMDEPSLGLAPKIIQEIFVVIKEINSDGIPVLLVEQNSNEALKVADRGYVLETGEIVLEDTARNLRNNEEVKKSYLGG